MFILLYFSLSLFTLMDFRGHWVKVKTNVVKIEHFSFDFNF